MPKPKEARPEEPQPEEPQKDLVQEIAEVWDLLQSKLPPAERRTLDDHADPDVGDQLRLFERPRFLTFAPREVESLVRRAKKPIREDESLPAPEGWSLDARSAMALLAGFPALSMQPGHVLVTFRFVQGGNGHGETWAVPADALEALEVGFPLVPSVDPLGHRTPEGGPAPGTCMPRPEPAEGVRDFMTKVRGDGTPWRYVQASFFAREAEEIGARWHGAGWGWHRLLGTRDTRKIEAAVALSWELDPSEPPPERYDVRFTRTGAIVEVDFHTYDPLGQERIVRHRDCFASGGYAFTSASGVVALGPGFMVT